MAYQLKTTGIAANVTMMIAVDPDTSTVKDFGSSAVTADLLVGANVTTSSQAWDGVTRHYWMLGSGATSADMIGFGTNKPNWTFNASGQDRTVVWIGEVAGASARAFGQDSNNYFASTQLGAGGSTTPSMFVGSTGRTGGNAVLSSGNKRIFGFVVKHSVSTTAYLAADTASSMTVTSGLGVFAGTSSTQNYDLQYVGRRDDGTTKQQDKVHAIIIANALWTEANFDALRDDWFGTLLESAGGGGSGIDPQIKAQFFSQAAGHASFY